MLNARTRSSMRDVRQADRRWRALLTSLALALAVASVPVAAWAIPASMPLAQEEEAAEPTAGEPIADGRARLPRGDIAWTFRRIDIPSGDELAVAEFPTGFVLVAEGAVTVRAEDDEEPTELAEGEAALLPDRKAGTLANTGDAPATLYEIALVPARDAAADEATGAVVGEPFAAPDGDTFQIELVRNTLTGQDETTIPVAASRAPVLYLTTDGTAQLQAGEQVVDLTAGQFALLAGEVQIRAAGEEPATYVVAAIGEEAEAREPGDREQREERPARTPPTRGRRRRRRRRPGRVRSAVAARGAAGSAGPGGARRPGATTGNWRPRRWPGDRRRRCHRNCATPSRHAAQRSNAGTDPSGRPDRPGRRHAPTRGNTAPGRGDAGAHGNGSSGRDADPRADRVRAADQSAGPGSSGSTDRSARRDCSSAGAAPRGGDARRSGRGGSSGAGRRRLRSPPGATRATRVLPGDGEEPERLLA